MKITGKVYVKTFGALLGLLVLTVGLALVNLGPFNLPVALAVAICKALLIMWIFMHVSISNPLIWLVAGGGFIWLLILLGLTLADYASRGW